MRRPPPKSIHRVLGSREPELAALVAEAALLYAVPQLEGLDRDDAVDIHEELLGLFGSTDGAAISRRLRDLYPQVPRERWKEPAGGSNPHGDD